MCKYLGQATHTRPGVWSIGLSMKTGYEDRLKKPEWVKRLILETDNATGNESRQVTREMDLSVLERGKPSDEEEMQLGHAAHPNLQELNIESSL